MQKIIISGLLLAMLGLWSCANDSPEQSSDPIPKVTSVTLNYSEVNRSLFIAAQVADAQGWENVDSVTFNLYRVGASDSLTGELYLSGNLVDDGPPRDIITRDGVFSYLIDSTELGSYEGYYRVYITAYDIDGNLSESDTATELVQSNSAPELYLIDVPNTFEKGDTLKFYFRVTDIQGYDDIAHVWYSILRPDDVYLPMFYTLNDNGVAGDEKAGDGLFTIFQPTNPASILQGLYYFYFYADDYSGAMSDTITVKITNPGIHITAPESAVTLHFGDTLQIAWESAYITQVKIEYAFDANVSSPNWIAADTLLAALKKYDWIVPSTQVTNYCKVRVSDLTTPKRYDVNDNYLVIVQ